MKLDSAIRKPLRQAVFSFSTTIKKVSVRCDTNSLPCGACRVRTDGSIVFKYRCLSICGPHTQTVISLPVLHTFSLPPRRAMHGGLRLTRAERSRTTVSLF